MNQRYSVLVVEDDLSWQLLLQEILEDEGYSVELAESKDEAISKLKQKTFDIALIDLRLVDADRENLDGIEVLRELRKMNMHTQAIVKSGFLELDIEEQLRELGVFGKLDKSGSGADQKRKLIDLVSKAASVGSSATGSLQKA